MGVGMQNGGGVTVKKQSEFLQISRALAPLRK